MGYLPFLRTKSNEHHLRSTISGVSPIPNGMKKKFAKNYVFESSGLIFTKRNVKITEDFSFHPFMVPF